MEKLKIALAEIYEQDKPRFLLGITGSPGAGKSTLADRVLRRWNEGVDGKSFGHAVIVPMDGYHLSNEELEQLGLLHLKGIPETFDAKGFVEKLALIRSNPNNIHYCPRFDRSIEASIPNDIAVPTNANLVIVEGNYLLLDSEPWSNLKQLFDASWFIEADDSILIPRLLKRHEEGGKSSEQARKKVDSTDLPNARLIEESKILADKIFSAYELIDR